MSVHFVSKDEEIHRVGQVLASLSPRSASTPLALWKITTIVKTVCGASHKSKGNELIRAFCRKLPNMTRTKMMREVDRTLKRLPAGKAPMGLGTLMYVLRDDSPAEFSRLQRQWRVEESYCDDDPPSVCAFIERSESLHRVAVC